MSHSVQDPDTNSSSNTSELEALCKHLKHSPMRRIRRTSKILDMLDQNTDHFNAEEFSESILEATRLAAPEFYVVARYGAPFTNNEEFEAHEAKIKAETGLKNPYNLSRLRHRSREDAASNWTEIDQSLCDIIVDDLKVNIVTGIRIDVADFKIFDYQHIIARIAKVHKPQTSVIWNELGSFLTRETKEKSPVTNLTITGVAVSKIRDYFTKNPDCLDSYLFASSYLQTMYRDVSPYANSKLEPEIRAVLDKMLVNKMVINEHTVREAFSHTTIETFAEKGIITRDVIMSDFPINNATMGYKPGFKTRPNTKNGFIPMTTPSPSPSPSPAGSPKPDVNLSVATKQNQGVAKHKTKFPQCPTCRKPTHAEEFCPWTRDGRKTQYWTDTFPERPPHRTAARRAFDARKLERANLKVNKVNFAGRYSVLSRDEEPEPSNLPTIPLGSQ